MEKLMMSDIYMGLERQLKELEPKMCELKKLYEEHLNAAEKAEEEMLVIEGNMTALRKAITALQAVDMPPTQEEVKEAEKAKKEETAKKQLTWKHKKAYVVRYDRNGDILNKAPSQKAMARDMGWDQSSLSRFMRFDQDSQIAKKGYYFGWEY